MGPRLSSKWNVNRNATTYTVGKLGTNAYLLFGFDEIVELRDLLNTAIEAAER